MIVGKDSKALPLQCLKFINKIKENNYYIPKELKEDICEIERIARWYINEDDMLYKADKLLNNLNIEVKPIGTMQEALNSENFSMVFKPSKKKNIK